MYSSKDTKEQAAIVQKYYSDTPPAHFVDPIMDVTGQQEITEVCFDTVFLLKQTPVFLRLSPCWPSVQAFYSLQKFFKEVKMQQKGISLNAKPRLPKQIDAAAVKQARSSLCQAFMK